MIRTTALSIFSTVLLGVAVLSAAEPSHEPLHREPSAASAKVQTVDRLYFQEGARLEEGGFPILIPGMSSGSVVSVPVEPRSALASRLGGTQPDRVESVDKPLRWDPSRSPRTERAVGDRLTISLDDDFGPSPTFSWESKAQADGSAAGPSDWLALRVPFRSLAIEPPVDITEVYLGLDNLNSRTVWPQILVTLEDVARPLNPDLASPGAEIQDFDTTTLLSAPPATSTRPTEFLRTPIGLAGPVAHDGSWIGSPAMTDDFEAGSGRPLDSPDSDWLECTDADCSLPQDMFVRDAGSTECTALGSACVHRAQGLGSALAVKFPDAAMSEIRPWLETDQALSVSLDLTDAAATRAGVAARISASDTYYRIEYVKASHEVEVHAVVQGNATALSGSPLAVPGPDQSDTPQLRAVVAGINPVEIEVFVGGNSLGIATDGNARLTGTLVGLTASDTNSAGERWDDFLIDRRRDVFVAVRHPEGEFSALPIDVSSDSLVTNAVLSSTDPAGAGFAPRALGQGCANPGNPYLQIEVEDTTTGGSLFESGANLVELDIACATCPEGRNRCWDNRSDDERMLPVYSVNAMHSVSVSFWNEHLAATDYTIEGEIYDMPCELVDPFVTPAVFQASVPLASQPGQDTGVVLSNVSLGDFTPLQTGAHCLMVRQTGLSNLRRTIPGFLVRQIDIYADPADPVEGCTPKVSSNLSENSFRVAKVGGDPLGTILTWEVVDTGQFPEDVNLHTMEAERYDRTDFPLGFEEFGPIFSTVVGTEPPRTVIDIPAPDSGRALWMAVYETDGCPTGNSILP